MTRCSTLVLLACSLPALAQAELHTYEDLFALREALAGGDLGAGDLVQVPEVQVMAPPRTVNHELRFPVNDDRAAGPDLQVVLPLHYASTRYDPFDPDHDGGFHGRVSTPFFRAGDTISFVAALEEIAPGTFRLTQVPGRDRDHDHLFFHFKAPSTIKHRFSCFHRLSPYELGGVHPTAIFAKETQTELGVELVRAATVGTLSGGSGHDVLGKKVRIQRLGFPTQEAAIEWAKRRSERRGSSVPVHAEVRAHRVVVLEGERIADEAFTKKALAEVWGVGARRPLAFSRVHRPARRGAAGALP